MLVFKVSEYQLSDKLSTPRPKTANFMLVISDDQLAEGWVPLKYASPEHLVQFLANEVISVM